MAHQHSSGCSCSEDAKQNDAVQTSLYSSIDRDRIWCLNESEPNSGRKCVKPWSSRNDSQRLLSDPDDGEMLLAIPFVTAVNIKTITIMAWGDWQPKKVKMSAASAKGWADALLPKLQAPRGGAEDPNARTSALLPLALPLLSFVNRDDLDLSSVHDVSCAQELELAEDPDGFVDYPLKQNKFQNVSTLLLFVTESVGGEQSGIQWINVKGVATQVRLGVGCGSARDVPHGALMHDL